MKTTIFIDLHGVLVDSNKMKLGYREEFRNFYKKFDYSTAEADEYHTKGLNFYLQSIEQIKNEKLVDNEFHRLMDESDKAWDRLMSSFIPHKYHKKYSINSRKIEETVGAQSNMFYSDAFIEFPKFLSDTDQFEVFITSNSHSVHVKGILIGARLNDHILEDHILGWDKMGCLKDAPIYYQRLLQKQTNPNTRAPIIVGNSSEEVLLASKIGFKTVLINREKKVNSEVINTADLVQKSMNNLYSLIKQYI